MCDVAIPGGSLQDVVHAHTHPWVSVHTGGEILYLSGPGKVRNFLINYFYYFFAEGGKTRQERGDLKKNGQSSALSCKIQNFSQPRNQSKYI